jgi:hypothetical protein
MPVSPPGAQHVDRIIAQGRHGCKGDVTGRNRLGSSSSLWRGHGDLHGAGLLGDRAANAVMGGWAPSGKAASPIRSIGIRTEVAAVSVTPAAARNPTWRVNRNSFKRGKAGRNRPPPHQSASAPWSDHMVDAFPTPAADETWAPLMNHIATLPLVPENVALAVADCGFL